MDRKDLQISKTQFLEAGSNIAIHLNGDADSVRDSNEKKIQELKETDKSNNQAKRTLWLARALRAKDKVNAYHYMGWWMLEVTGMEDGVDLRYSLGHGTKIRHMPHVWVRIWENIESKCRTYADKFKE